MIDTLLRYDYFSFFFLIDRLEELYSPVFSKSLLVSRLPRISSSSFRSSFSIPIFLTTFQSLCSFVFSFFIICLCFCIRLSFNIISHLIKCSCQLHKNKVLYSADSVEVFQRNSFIHRFFSFYLSLHL